VNRLITGWLVGWVVGPCNSSIIYLQDIYILSPSIP